MHCEMCHRTCQHLKRCSVAVMRLLFLSEELRLRGKGAWMLDRGEESNGGLSGNVRRGYRLKGSLPEVGARKYTTCVPVSVFHCTSITANFETKREKGQ